MDINVSVSPIESDNSGNKSNPDFESKSFFIARLRCAHIFILLSIVSLPPPELECAWSDFDGTTTLNWNHNILASNATNYYIYGSYNIGGPYLLLSIVSYPDNIFLLSDSLFSASFEYFYITNSFPDPSFIFKNSF